MIQIIKYSASDKKVWKIIDQALCDIPEDGEMLALKMKRISVNFLIREKWLKKYTKTELK